MYEDETPRKRELTPELIRKHILFDLKLTLPGMVAGLIVVSLATALAIRCIGFGILTCFLALVNLMLLVGMVYLLVELILTLRSIFTVAEDTIVNKQCRHMRGGRHGHVTYHLYFRNHSPYAVPGADYIELYDGSEPGDLCYLVLLGRQKKIPSQVYLQKHYEWKG